MWKEKFSTPFLLTAYAPKGHVLSVVDHRSLIKNLTQTAVINIVNSQHFYINFTFSMLVNIHFQKWSKVTVKDEKLYMQNWQGVWKWDKENSWQVLAVVLNLDLNF